jgi:hypothetical protein
MYPGVGADLAGIAPISTSQLMQNRRAAEAAGSQDAAGTGNGIYQPFTQFTGIQQPNSFSERDLYQETQSQ